MLRDYVTLRCLRATARSQRLTTLGYAIFSDHLIGTLHPPEAFKAAERYQVVDVEASAEMDHRLFRPSKEVDDQGALLCLRCRASHAAVLWLKTTFEKYTQMGYELEPMAMASCLLDDDGRLHPFTPPRADSKGEVPQYEPFLLDVVRRFNPERAGLSTWTQQRAISNSCLAGYFKSVGLLLKSDWSLLAHDAGPRNITDAWKRYGKLSLTAEQVVSLLTAYQAAYEKRGGSKHRRWEPSEEFLELISPGQPHHITLMQLRAMAQALRDRQTLGSRDTERDIESVERVTDLASNLDSWNVILEVEKEAQLASVDQALRHALDLYMPQVLPIPDPANGLLVCLWEGYGEGMNNRSIAERCGCSAGTVSTRLTNALNNVHAPAIARRALAELKRHPDCAATLGKDLGATEQAVALLCERLLSRGTAPDGVLTPLAYWISSNLHHA